MQQWVHFKTHQWLSNTILLLQKKKKKSKKPWISVCDQCFYIKFIQFASKIDWVLFPTESMFSRRSGSQVGWVLLTCKSPTSNNDFVIQKLKQIAVHSPVAYELSTEINRIKLQDLICQFKICQHTWGDLLSQQGCGLGFISNSSNKNKFNYWRNCCPNLNLTL